MSLPGICQTCGATMFLSPNYGDWFWVCPNQYAVPHPETVTVTTDNTSLPPQSQEPKS